VFLAVNFRKVLENRNVKARNVKAPGTVLGFISLAKSLKNVR